MGKKIGVNAKASHMLVVMKELKFLIERKKELKRGSKSKSGSNNSSVNANRIVS
jgi:hypothetical protein